MAKTELLDGVRVNKRTGLPAPPNTPRQEASLANAKQAGTIDMGTLTTPVTPAKLTVPTPSTGGDALAGAIQTGADQFVQNLSDQRKLTEAPKTQSLQDLISATLNSQGQTELTALEYGRQDGADTAKSELQDINNQLLQEQQGQRRREEAILKNPQGLETGALNAELQRSRDESLSRQADLSVIQLAKQGKYDSAKEIADRAVAVKMEQEQRKLDALKLNYEENKELFTKAEQREFEVMYGDRKQKMEMEAYKEKAKYDQIIKQSDPLYQAQLAKAKAEVVAISELPGGVASGGLTTQPAYAKLTATQKRQADSINNLVNYLNEYKTLYRDTVDGNGNLIWGKNAALLEGKLNALMFAAAQAEGTGALQQADREVLEKVLPNPTSILGIPGTILKGGKEGGLLKIEDQIGKYANNLAGLGLETVSGNTGDPLGLGLDSGEATVSENNPLGI